MDEYRLSSKSLYQILLDKNIKAFHHANTVGTSLTFIQNNALLSRKFVEDNGLYQTAQNSDAIDKEYSIYDDIFLDGLDLHKHFNRNSPYGPIMFKIDLKILTLPDFQYIYIMKDNPTNWKSRPDWSDRYYKNLDEFQEEYLNSQKIRDGQIMFTFKNHPEGIKLNKFCKEIIVDSPLIFSSDKKKVLGSLTKDRIIEELKKKNNLGHIKITPRHETTPIMSCWCTANYNFMNKSKIESLFAIKFRE